MIEFIANRYYNTNTIYRNIRVHIIFWLIYFLLNFLRWGSYFGDYSYSIKSNLVEFPIHIILVYFNLNFLLPSYIPKNVTKYIAFLLLSVLIMSLFRIVVTYQLVTTDIWRESVNQEHNLFDPNYILAVAIGELYVIGLTTAIKLMINWVKTQRKAHEIELKGHEMELSFLRSQLQPHFFFNTLNSLYALTLDKSDKAPETVLKLSEFMSYVVYQNDDDHVLLNKEIEHIKNYIDLEKLRYGDKLNVRFEVTGNVNGKFIPSLILLPFVENTFKHGIPRTKNKIPIEIYLNVIDKRLNFEVSNIKMHQIANKKNGIGIQNTKRRLELLFKNEFEFNIDETNDKYTVKLNFPFYDHKMSNS